MKRRLFPFALCAALAACEANQDDDDPPPPAAQPAQPAAQVAAQPSTPTQPAAAPVAPVAPPAAPQLLGMYELAWRQDNPASPVLQMPGLLIDQFPNCIWARWGWEFMEDGSLAMSNEMLCRVPPDIGQGYGVCRAEFLTGVQWRQGGFGTAAPVRAQGRFVNIRQQQNSDALESATVRCSVGINAINATLTEPVPGPGPSRPQEVTLVLADGTRMHLRAVDAEVDHRQIIQNTAPAQ